MAGRLRMAIGNIGASPQPGVEWFKHIFRLMLMEELGLTPTKALARGSCRRAPAESACAWLIECLARDRVGGPSAGLCLAIHSPCYATLIYCSKFRPLLRHFHERVLT